jgi:hypothetical protein
MNEVVVLTPERILEVTEDVLRRYGLAKATVVDVARALDVSHGSVYRHFPARPRCARRWPSDGSTVSARPFEDRRSFRPGAGAAGEWLRTMFSIKHKRLGDDPEMFATY